MGLLRHLTLAAVLLAPAGLLRAEPAIFATPEAAVAAFVAALQAQDRTALLTVFGDESDDLIWSDDPAGDAEARDAFLQAYANFSRLQPEGTNRMELQVGRTRWPFPVTLVSAAGGWSFDPAAARDEILARRIGQNELEVIDLMRRAVSVQADFRNVDHDGDGVMEFASTIISDAGERNGLYWPSAEGVPDSPIGAFMAQAAADGVSVDGQDTDPQPFHGYYFRILKAQGAAAPGGAYDYMIGGNMVAGHALLAYPAAPDDTGIMSFVVGENGIVFEADLGAETLAVAGAMAAFDPGDGWIPVAE